METLIQFLVSASIKASLLIVLLFVIHLLFSRWMAPRWRHLLWGLVAIRLLMPTVFESNLSVFNLGDNLKGAETAAAHAPAPDPTVSIVAETEATPLTTSPVTTEPQEVGLIDRLKSISPYYYVFGIWLAGALILFLLIMRATWRFHRAIRQERPATDHTRLKLLDDCKAQLGITGAVQLIETSLVTTPALLGVFRPRILLPEDVAQTFSVKELRFVFLHELTHLKRRDILINWLVTFAQIMHWFNPLVWLAFFRMHAEREQACDESVLSSIDESDRKLYGHTLIELMGAQTAPLATVGMVGILERNKQLKRRIGMIRQFKHKPLWHALLACSIAVTIGVATLTDAAAKTSPSKPVTKVEADPGTTKQVTVEVKILKLHDSVSVTADKMSFGNGCNVFTGKPKIAFAKGKEPDVLAMPKVTVANGKLARIGITEERDDKKKPNGTVVKLTPTLVKNGITVDVDVSVVDEAGETKIVSSVATKPGEPVYIFNSGKKGKRLLVMLTAYDAANPPNGADPFGGPTAMQKKLKSIVFRKIGFTDARLSIVLDFLKVRSRALDTEGQGVNFLLKLPKGKKEPTVTMDLTDVDLKSLLDAVSKVTGLKYSVDENAVLIGDFKPEKRVKAKTALHKKLDKTVIAKMSFADARLSTVLHFLKNRSKAIDPDGKGVNFVLLVNNDKKEEPTVTMDFDNIPMSMAIKYICEVAGATYEIREKMVVVTTK